MSEENLAQMTLGGGCFWCLEAVFEQIEGVSRVVSGYAGGHVRNPSYREVCGKNTGHAEVVQITFDPQQISAPDLLDIFFSVHDPTTPNRQGADEGPQYRSIILYHNLEQQQLAQQAIAEMDVNKVWPNPIVTEVKPLDAFYPAEAEHQHYYQRNTRQPYCQMVIEPKLAKLRSLHKDKLVEN